MKFYIFVSSTQFEYQITTIKIIKEKSLKIDIIN